MKMFRLISLVVTVALSSVAVSQAQNVIEEVNSTSAADIMKRMPTNAVYVYDDFRPGVVYFKDGTRASANLNYCFLLDEMHFRGKDGKVEALANSEKVSLVKIGDDAYFYAGKSSFVQMVIYDDDVRLCYKRHTKLATDEGNYGAYGTATETVSASKVQRIAYVPGIKDLDNLRDLKYTVEDDYVLLSKGKIITIRSAKAFEKAFPKLKNKIREYTDSNKFDAKSPDDVVAMMEFCVRNK